MLIWQLHNVEFIQRLGLGEQARQGYKMLFVKKCELAQRVKHVEQEGKERSELLLLSLQG